MFNEIIGHRNQCLFLEKSMAANRVAHAYLFLGPARVGKMALARAFAQTFLATVGAAARSLEVNPDVTVVTRLVDEKTDALRGGTSVEQIRELRERLSYSSLLPSGKFAIVADAHTMTTEAANALLKTLEEPRGRTVMVLIASDLRTIPETVRSRCQLIRFGLVPRRELEDGLVKRGVVARDAERFSLIARGRPGVAIGFHTNPDAFAELTAVIDERAALRSKPLYDQLAWVEERSKQWNHDRVHEEFSLWRELLRDELLDALHLPQLKGITPSTRAMAGKADIAHVIRHMHRLAESEQAIRHHGDGRLALEHVLIS